MPKAITNERLADMERALDVCMALGHDECRDLIAEVRHLRAKAESLGRITPISNEM